MLKQVALFYFVYAGFHVRLSVAYPEGAPEDSYRACQTMVPGHGYDPQPNTTASPATLTLDRTVTTAGEKVKLTLKAKDGQHFKGFIIQARNAKKPELRSGSFVIDPAFGQLMNCGDGVRPGFNNSVTHSSRKEKTEIEAFWVAPEKFEGEVVFRYSVVQELKVFWAGLEAEQRVAVKALEVPKL